MELALFGDAVSVPMHWYYDEQVLHEHYCPRGTLDGIVPVRQDVLHPNSWKYFSSVDPLDRDVHPFDLFHDKAGLFSQPGAHYHGMLEEGQVTLTCLLMIQLYNSVRLNNGNYDGCDYGKRYKQMLLVPGMHNDTYIESSHRTYFRRLSQSSQLIEPPGDHREDCLGGLVLALPLLAIKQEQIESLCTESKVYSADQWTGRAYSPGGHQGEIRAFSGDIWCMRGFWSGCPAMKHVTRTHGAWRLAWSTDILNCFVWHIRNTFTDLVQHAYMNLYSLWCICGKQGDEWRSEDAFIQDAKRIVKTCAAAALADNTRQLSCILRQNYICGPKWNR
uniref:Uncharacterized protein n=1 Tax=Mucochytrium quahogii TaxID=96639 RepID=A0A7S2RNV1_9STRA